MSSPFDVEPRSLDALASRPILLRGRNYARDGHVLVSRVRGDRLEARVRGTGRAPYFVTVEWDGEEFLSDCTCPFDAEPFCKHAIAALLAAVGDSGGEGESRPPQKPRRDEELDVRRKRGRREAEDGLSVKNLDGERYFGRFRIESPSGRSYVVEIRSLKHLQNRCGCPDFASNLLGTCKHIEAVLHRLRKRAPRKTALLAERLPPVSFVFVRRIDEPRIWVQRGSGESPRLKRILDRAFDADGAFRGDPARDFPEFRRRADGVRGLVVGEEAVEFAELRAQEIVARAHRARQAELVQAQGTRLPGVDAELYPYQTRGVAFLAGTGRAILADDMGLGKTIQAIAACQWLKAEAGVERVLVICPASLKHQWAREIERFVGARAVVVQGGVPVRADQYRERAAFTIVNYELALRDGERIEALDADVLVLDEAQRIKNWRTKTAEAIKSIRTRFSFVLTGTPVENRLDDLYSLMQVVDRRILGPLWSFNERFVELAETGNRVLGYRNLGRLREVLRPVFLRRDRAQVLSQLPDRTDNRFLIGMTPRQRDYMDENVQVASMLISRSLKRPLTPSEHKRLMAAFQRARMACDAAGLVDHETVGSPKLDEFARVLEEVCLDAGRKVVVFSEWERMIRMAAARAEQLGIGHCILSGSVPTPKRGALIDRFREDPGVKVFFSTDAGGLGLNLQAAQTVINLDLPWNPARLEQRIARVHRLGQPRNVNVILLVAEKSIEERIESILQVKRDLFNAVVDADSEVVELSTRSKGLQLMGEVLADETTSAPAEPAGPGAPERAVEPGEPGEPERPEADRTGPAPEVPAPGGPVSGIPVPEEDVARRLEDALGFRLIEIKRTGSGRLVVVVDRKDEQVVGTAREIAGEDAVVVDRAEVAVLDSFGEDSPLHGAETLRARADAPDRADARREELSRVARRRLEAARKLAEAGLGPEALEQARSAMQTRVRALLLPDDHPEDPADLIRAAYERLLPEGRLTMDQLGALSRVSDLGRVYADRDLEVPEALLAQSIEDAAGFVKE